MRFRTKDISAGPGTTGKPIRNAPENNEEASSMPPKTAEVEGAAESAEAAEAQAAD